ncbi:TetR family transcriptional regulator [Streptomyces sp. WAC 06738]|uniref:TetR/AcrR family transcriptional regulator n=1 Tax=Streptomyces sp. WAC 06738 TaxID=2203210 RepID=UPI000F6D93FB|nr:TetR/AcrR family transcriptional regulator [Streptomyces sp. WAC 06738]AZM48534.1 TetR family transcriptional regulator [Streptomyces sp. WAC 06738]
MPTARESLLDAAFAALRSRPWAAVRMVDVAAAAGVSRQTLYNEFGSKEGLAQALVRREIDGYLAGVERTLAGARRSGADAGGRLLALVAWTLRAARGNPLVRAALTGCWGEQLPTPARRVPARGGTPGARRRDPSVETPAELVEEVRDRVLRALEEQLPGTLGERRRVCEAVTRLTLSYVIAPAARGEDVERTVRGLLALSAPSRTTAGR